MAPPLAALSHALRWALHPVPGARAVARNLSAMPATTAAAVPQRSIRLRDALQAMGTRGPDGQPIPFSYVRYTWNRKTSRGGERITVPHAVLLTEAALPNPRSMRVRRAQQAARAAKPDRRSRVGEHFRKATRDFLLPTGEKDRAIVWLITEFNGMRVLL